MVSPQFMQEVVHKIKDKGLKYILVTVVNVLLGQTLFFCFVKFLHLAEIEANLLAGTISSIPAFYMSRAWVWGREGKSHFRREILPFWIFVILGLLFSTFAISMINHYTESTLLHMITILTAYGVLWVLRFFLLDKLFHVELGDEETTGPVTHHIGFHRE